MSEECPAATGLPVYSNHHLPSEAVVNPMSLVVGVLKQLPEWRLLLVPR
jgi:hypothetical protein